MLAWIERIRGGSGFRVGFGFWGLGLVEVGVCHKRTPQLKQERNPVLEMNKCAT